MVIIICVCLLAITVALLKFVHVLCALGLLGLIVYGFIDPSKPLSRKIILGLSVLALLTGTLLVHPKHFTFHTPWIQAAYSLLLVFVLMTLWISAQKNKLPLWVWRLIYLVLIAILAIIIHDAVMKTVFL